jgi:hypothetical protein
MTKEKTMDNHQLAEKLSSLASRVNNLAVLHTGEDSRELFKEQIQLADLAQAAIIENLNAEHDAYEAALSGLNEAINFIGDADHEIGNVATAISLVAKAANLADTALKVAVS